MHISFEEANAFMTAADDYPTLKTIKWYGSDGTATSGTMLDDATVRNFALNVSYPSTIFAPTHSDKWQMVRQHGIAELGREPESYSYAVYDIVWAYALSLLVTDQYNATAIKNVLPDVTQAYSGASGKIQLDVNGDRMAGDYDIWQITNVSPEPGYKNTGYDWKVIGTYVLATDSVVWK